MKYKLLRFSLLSILSMLWGTMVAADFGVDLRDAKGTQNEELPFRQDEGRIREDYLRGPASG